MRAYDDSVIVPMIDMIPINAANRRRKKVINAEREKERERERERERNRQTDRQKERERLK